MSAMLQHQIMTSRGPLPSLLWLPQGATGRVPGIVVFQEIYGLSPYIRARCADLAELGYAVLAPQLFARLDPPVVAVRTTAHLRWTPTRGQFRYRDQGRPAAPQRPAVVRHRYPPRQPGPSSSLRSPINAEDGVTRSD